MADKVEIQMPVIPQSLVCPLCLDAFKNATLLRCGHTFCKNCLVKYDGKDLMLSVAFVECPVCRKRTRLGQDRIDGLPSNFSVKGLEVELQAKGDANSSHFCSLHSQIYKDILCETCGEFICLNCFCDKHQGHKIKKKEEIEADLKKKRDAVIEKSLAKKSQMERSINNTEQWKRQAFTSLDNLEREIREAYAKKVTALQKKEEKLLKEVNDIKKKSGKAFGDCIFQKRHSVNVINQSLTTLTSNTNIGKYLDSETLKAHQTQFSNLEKSLKDLNNEGYAENVKQMVEDTGFCPAHEDALDLGHIQPPVEKTVHTMTQLIHMSYRSSPTIVQRYELNHSMSGLAALSKDAVVVSYGYSRKGSDCFSVSGETKPHLKNNERIGHVKDVAIFSDGRSVAVQNDRCFVYSTQGRRKKDCEYWCQSDRTWLCSDHNDNFYTVHASPRIRIFHGRSPHPDKVVSTGNIEQNRISVSKTGALITSSDSTRDSLSTVNVHNVEGHAVGSLKANQGESLYATVDSLDRVLIAGVRSESNTMKLVRYTLQGTSLKEPCVFKTLKLPDNVSPRNCYMVSLTPNLIAFASSMHLYFMELSAK